MLRLCFTSAVDASTGRRLLTQLSRAAEAGESEIGLLIASRGGDIDEALELHRLIRALPSKITTQVVGRVEMPGLLVALAGDDRLAVPGAVFALRGAAFRPESGRSYRMTDLWSVIDRLKEVEERAIAVLGDRTELSPEEIREALLEPTDRSSDWALEKAIVGRIEDIPAGTVPIVVE